MKATASASLSAPLRSASEELGFFGRILIHQLNKIEHGWLELHFDGSVHSFGQANSSLSARIEVKDSSFFRKVCLGGSLGVADSYAAGDWETDDMVMLFRLFLQNLDVMDGMEGGWATVLNKFARWAYLD